MTLHGLGGGGRVNTGDRRAGEVSLISMSWQNSYRAVWVFIVIITTTSDEEWNRTHVWTGLQTEPISIDVLVNETLLLQKEKQTTGLHIFIIQWGFMSVHQKPHGCWDFKLPWQAKLARLRVYWEDSLVLRKTSHVFCTYIKPVQNLHEHHADSELSLHL